MSNFKDLLMWQKGMGIVKEVYLLTKKLPKDEIHGLTSQMRRAAVSIPSNIAEGSARYSKREFHHFIMFAEDLQLNFIHNYFWLESFIIYRCIICK
jgi:hypothetical protein